VIFFSKNNLKIYIINLDNLKDKLDYFKSILSKEELLKAENIKNTKEYEKYIVIHGKLRDVLSKYIKISPKSIIFEYNKHKKPFILKNQNVKSLYFNISHTKNILIIAIIFKNKFIGVDIEDKLRKINNNLFNYVLSPFECLTNHHFFDYWTFKESVLKAVGCGIITKLNSISIDFNNKTIKLPKFGFIKKLYVLKINYKNYIITACLII